MKSNKCIVLHPNWPLSDSTRQNLLYPHLCYVGKNNQASQINSAQDYKASAAMKALPRQSKLARLRKCLKVYIHCFQIKVFMPPSTKTGLVGSFCSPNRKPTGI